MNAQTRVPAEWEPHSAVWLAWPAHQPPWEDTPMDAVRTEFVGLCRAIGEALHILVPDATHEMAAKAALTGTQARFHHVPFGDIWLRDTAPIFGIRGDKRLAHVFRFNGWGGKFIYPDDDQVAERIAQICADPTTAADWVLEGGSLDTDGAGTFLTTEECLLHANRNPSLDRAAIEDRLASDLGARKVLWLKHGLLGDHTDGHIDNIARFVAPGHVVCMEPNGNNDPNRDILRSIIDALSVLTDANGRPLEVSMVPSPGRVLDRHGSIMAASHVNFYIANTTVIVPMYPNSGDTDVLERIQKLFPSRQVVGRPAWNILHGGGSFHCITQQVPALP